MTNLPKRETQCDRCRAVVVTDDAAPRCTCGGKLYTILRSALTGKVVVSSRAKDAYGLGATRG